MYCQNCGNALEGGANFCPTCGQAASAPRKSVAAQSPTVSAPPTVADAALPNQHQAEQVRMTLKHVLFSFRGRIGRIKFLTGWVLVQAVCVVALLLTAVINPTVPADTVWTSFIAVFLWPNLALWSKRMQDCNHSPIILLLLFIPIIGLAIVLFAFFSAGTNGPNKYGEAANVMPPPMAPTENIGHWQ